jgi:hypothetical protein
MPDPHDRIPFPHEVQCGHGCKAIDLSLSFITSTYQIRGGFQSMQGNIASGIFSEIDPKDC